MSDSQRILSRKVRLWFSVWIAMAACSLQAQQDQPKIPPVPGPMLADGVMKLDTPDFDLMLVRSSQTVAALKPRTAPDFDFTPGDLLVARSQNGYFHLGDVTLRLRADGSDEWKNYSTAQSRTPGTASRAASIAAG